MKQKDCCLLCKFYCSFIFSTGQTDDACERHRKRSADPLELSKNVGNPEETLCGDFKRRKV